MDYNFENLILVVGTNPLPDYVVAQYFLNKNPGTRSIYLIHSENSSPHQSGTSKYANNIKELLKSKCPHIEFIQLEDVSRSDIIMRNIMDRLKGTSTSGCHLNYTGGTKAMVIHAYRVIEQLCGSDKASFSYLDARSFELIDDKIGTVSEDLRNEVTISLNDLLFLHNFNRVNEDHQLEFRESLEKFRELIEKDRLDEFFSTYNREYFLSKNKKDQLVSKLSEIKDELRNMKAQEPLLSIVLAMPEEYQIFNSNGSFKEPQSNKKLEKIVKFLDGEWLEWYVYDTLKEQMKDCETYIDWEISGNWRSNRTFQIDVALLKGYQLTGISCTTSDSLYTCKSKGFEILLRVRQMGGEEARAVVVTRLSSEKKDSLNDELVIDTGSAKNILVLGNDDLKSEIMIKKIKDFINDKGV